MIDPEYKLKEASPEDIDELLALCMEAIRATCITNYTAEQISAWLSKVNDRGRCEKIMKSQYVLKMMNGKEIIGFGTLDNRSYIDLFYVHKDYQRRGVASSIYYNLEKEAKRREISIISGDISKTARPFFERQGFVVQTEQTFLIGEVSISNYKMMKKI